MASVLNQRPYFIVDGQETELVMRKLFKMIQKEAKALENEPIKIKYGDKEIVVFVKVNLDQMDGKATRLAQGRPSAYCVCCSITREQAHNVLLISNGINIDLSTEEIMKKYYELLAYQESRKNPDFEINHMYEHEDEDDVDRIEYRLDTKILSAKMRQGMMTKPMVETLEVCNVISPLHCRLRSFTWITTLMMRFDAGKTKYREHIDDDAKKRFADIEKKYRDRSRIDLKKPMFLPKQGSGTSDTGDNSRWFFAEENREKILDKLLSVAVKPPEGATEEEIKAYEELDKKQKHFKKHIRKVIRNLSVILNIINSDKHVRVQEYAKFCTKTALYVRKNLPWVEFSNTVHQILAHSAQLIEENEGRGLLSKSEESSESTHKFVKYFREHGARKMNVFYNILDTMKKLWFKTDPGQRAFDKEIKCSKCLKFGHSCR